MCVCELSFEAAAAPTEHSLRVSCFQIHGSQDFDICVKDMVPADVPEHFRGIVSIWAMVTTVDGSQQVAFDDSTPVQRQLVDVRYSKVTRKQFKPGLSYVGMVSAGASAQQVPTEVAGSALPSTPAPASGPP